MRNLRRFAALGLAAAMALTIAPVAGAATVTGDSYLEGVEPEGVVAVVLPTIASGTYDFVLDPENLLAQYDANKANYTASSVYFANAGDPVKYTGTSDAAVAVNKSSSDVALSVEAAVTNVTTTTNAVTFTSKADVETDTDKNVYLGIVPGATGTVVGDAAATAGTLDATKAVAVATSGNDNKASATFVLAGDDANFETVQQEDTTVASGHKYVKVAKSTASWNTATFALEAKCNTTADWTAFNDKSQLTDDTAENLKTSVVYSMKPVTDTEKAQYSDTNASKIDSATGLITGTGVTFGEANIAEDKAATGFAATSYTVTKGTALNIPVDLGSGADKITVASSVIELQVNGSWINVGTAGFTYANEKITIADSMALKADSEFSPALAGNTLRTLRITFNGDTTKRFTTKLAILSA